MIRIYVKYEQVKAGDKVKFEFSHMHYITKVMRKQNEDKILIFNEKIGEWIVKINNSYGIVQNQTRKYKIQRRPNLAIACIKKPRMEWMIEKITELNVNEIYILQTQYSQNSYLDIRRLQRIMEEAAEQSNRISVPTLHCSQSLQCFIQKIDMKNWVALHPKATHSATSLNNFDGILIGPEGGWSETELSYFQNKVSIHSNILRSETAACAALSIWNFNFIA